MSDELRAEVERLRLALIRARDTIREWHNMPGLRRVTQADIDETWKLYQESPEMREINAALAVRQNRELPESERTAPRGRFQDGEPI